MLRAQVERLAEELKAYRRRISSGAGASGPSPPRPSVAPTSNFDFDFPRFGTVPEAYYPGVKNSASPSSNAPSRQATGGSASLQQTNGFPDAINGIFSDGFFNAVDRNEFGSIANNGSTTTSPDPLFDFTASSTNPASSNMSQSRSMSQSTASKATSPSVSSMSHKDISSSCGTSPESSSQSPNMQKDKEPQVQSVYRNGFIEERSIPAPDPATTDFNFDWLATQNGGQFDPVLFNDYRDSQAAVVGDGDFTGGFFDDSMPFADYDNFNLDLEPTTTISAPAPSKPSLLEQVAASREGNDEEDAKKLHERCSQTNNPNETVYEKNAMMTAHKIWLVQQLGRIFIGLTNKHYRNQLQNCPKFVSGDFDIDSLCTELSQKATCTETGVAVPKQAVEDALWRLVGENRSDQSSDVANSVLQRTK